MSKKKHYEHLLKHAYTDTQKKYIKAVLEHGSCGKAGKALKKHRRTVERVIKGLERSLREPETIVGIIGDTHIPYELKGYLEFCKKTFEREGVNKVIHIGDLFDNHALSFHESEPSLKGAYGEYVDALTRLEPWKEAFPEMIIVHGNHDAIPARQLTKMGLDPKIYLRPMSEVYEFPLGWTEVEEIEIDDVLYHHGHTSLGVNGFRNDAKNRMQKTVSGHAHGNFGVSYTACHHRLVWGMAVGCGVDVKSMAFAYGRHFKMKPVIGCGVVKDNGRLPLVFPMDLGEH